METPAENRRQVAISALKTHINDAIRLAKSTSHGGHTAAEDPIIRDRLAQLFIESEIFRVTNYRGLTKIMKNGSPVPRGRSGSGSGPRLRTQYTLMELALEIEGPYAQFPDGSEYALDGNWQYQFLRTRAN